MHEDGLTIEYEGHDVIRRGHEHNPKLEDQPAKLPSGKLTQNGLFIDAVNEYKKGLKNAEVVKVYEKVIDGVWSLKGYFDLVDYKVVNTETRQVFRFILKLSDQQEENFEESDKQLKFSRVIPSEVKKEVWKRDLGKCVICGDTENLHFDHELPFAKGGTSLSAANVQLMCMKHNLQKSDKIE